MQRWFGGLRASTQSSDTRIENSSALLKSPAVESFRQPMPIPDHICGENFLGPNRTHEVDVEPLGDPGTPLPEGLDVDQNCGDAPPSHEACLAANPPNAINDQIVRGMPML